MQKKNSCTLRICMLFCTIVLPFYSALGTHYKSPGKRPAGVATTPYSNKQARTFTSKKTDATKAEPVQSITAPTTQPANTNDEPDKEVNKEEEENKTADKKQPDTTTITTDSTKDVQAATPAPSTWSTIYNLLPQIFIKNFSTGSSTGIGAFTKTLIKQFMTRQAFISQKNEILGTLNKELYEANELLKKSDLPEVEKKSLIDTKELLSSEENKLSYIKAIFKTNKIDFDQTEKQTSLSSIVSAATSTALIYTASTMIGELMKTGLMISLQLLMPQSH